MKLDRLLAMTMILINRDRVRAQELAETFNVSVRTIYRDIDTLCQAGIPVITFQGTNGGIGLMEGYRLDKNILTDGELQAIAIALKSVSTSYDDTNTKSVLEKINSLTEQNQESIFIDFSPWGGNPLLKKKISLLKEAIAATTCVNFCYLKPNGEKMDRDVEPHTLVLKGRSWYLYGYCLNRNDFRLFKLTRMKNVCMNEKKFVRREIQLAESPWDLDWYDPKNIVSLKIIFDESIRTSMDEMFEDEQMTVDHKTGKCQITIEMPENDWMYGFLLSFLDNVEVVEPMHVRNRLKQLSKNIYRKYK